MLGLSLAPSAAGAQLSLAAALAEAEANAFTNRMSRATAAADRAEALAPLQGVIPTARIEASFVRTTDPIGAFGTTLRQRSVTPADFDPARLNFPPPINNYQAGVVLEVPLLNPDAWLGRRAAVMGAEASESRAAWTIAQTRRDVVRAYYGAVLAADRVTTLTTALQAARAHVSQAESMLRQGMVTKSDVLLAKVRSDEIEIQIAEARGSTTTALQQLALLLGRDPNDVPTVPAELPPDSIIREVAQALPGDALARADVEAAELAQDAARADALRTRSQLLPRVNALARYDWNAPSQLFGGDKNWTVGIIASLPLFDGGKTLSSIRAATARADIAHSMAELARAQATLDDERTRTALTVALERLTIAERAEQQAAEALRLVERRYAGGLAPVTEWLDAQASATASALAHSAARYETIGAIADRRHALGADPGALASLDVGHTSAQ